MDEETKSTLRSIFAKLEELALTLKRIEERQITAVRQEIKPGSFASTEG